MSDPNQPHIDSPDETIVQREVAPVEDEANHRVLEEVAAVEGVDITELPPLYDRIDNILENLFSEPPVPEAQVEITFSYHGYRVRIDQEGVITLHRLGPLPNAVDAVE